MKQILLGLLVAFAIFALGQEEKTERIGNFTLVISVDPINDVDKSYIYTPDLSGIDSRRGALVWRCDGQSIEIFMVAGKFLNSRENVPTEWRFDQGTPQGPTKWGISVNGTAVFVPSRLWLLFTDEALLATRLVIRVTDYRGEQAIYIFNLTGLKNALDRLPCYAQARANAKKVLDQDSKPREGVGYIKASDLLATGKFNISTSLDGYFTVTLAQNSLRVKPGSKDIAFIRRGQAGTTTVLIPPVALNGELHLPLLLFFELGCKVDLDKTGDLATLDCQGETFEFKVTTY